MYIQQNDFLVLPQISDVNDISSKLELKYCTYLQLEVPSAICTDAQVHVQHTHIHNITFIPLPFLPFQSPLLQKKLIDCLSEGLPLVVVDIEGPDLLHSRELSVMLGTRGKISSARASGKKHKIKVGSFRHLRA